MAALAVVLFHAVGQAPRDEKSALIHLLAAPVRALSGYGYAGKRDFEDALRLQGLPPDFLAEAPFTVQAKYHVIGNGVPLPMGRAVAAAVKRAMYPEWAAQDTEGAA